jgi:DNA replication and repair protein RecF
MIVTYFRVFHLRKWKTFEVEPVPGLNIFSGPNGSGKTTLLEGLHIIHSGKSFRTRHFEELVSHNEKEFEVKAGVSSIDQTSSTHTVAVRKTSISTVSKIDGVVVQNASTLARLLPLLLFEPNSFQVVEGGPRLRRGLIDKYLFHVKPDFLHLSHTYTHALEQRNALIKAKKKNSEFDYWSAQMDVSGTKLSELRKQGVEDLNQNLNKARLVQRSIGPVQLVYRQGWKEDRTLENALADSLLGDYDRGSTLVGPHKAELAINVEKNRVAKVASRGQTKVIVLSLIVAIAERLRLALGFSPIILVDDFTAELDRQTTQDALEAITSTGSQVFITALEPDLAENVKFPAFKTFHVKPEEAFV